MGRRHNEYARAMELTIKRDQAVTAPADAIILLLDRLRELPHTDYQFDLVGSEIRAVASDTPPTPMTEDEWRNDRYLHLQDIRRAVCEHTEPEQPKELEEVWFVVDPPANGWS